MTSAPVATRFTEGTLANLALVIVALWVLTQAAPFVPSLDWGNLKAGLKPTDAK